MKYVLIRHFLSSIWLIALAACSGSRAEDAPPTSGATAAAGSSVATAESSPLSATATDSIGRAVYTTCAICHQANGEGIGTSFSPLAGSEIVTGPAEIPVAIILRGIKGPVRVKGIDYQGMMMPLAGSFSDVQIAAVTTYIRSQWGNAAPPVTAELVARVRAATETRTAMWTWTELQRAEF